MFNSKDAHFNQFPSKRVPDQTVARQTMPATGPPLLVARLRSLLGIASPEAAAGSSPTTLEMPLEDLIKEVQYLHHALQHAQGIQKEREDHPGDDLETLGLQFLDACADRARKEKETVESSRLRKFYSEKFDGKVPDGPADEDAKWTRAFALASKLATVTDEAVLIAARRGISYSDPALYETRTFQFPMASTSVDIKPIKADPISVDLRLLKSPTSTFGLAQWGSGILLSNMITLGIVPLKAPVIDVGTGAGLVGITAAKKLASSQRLGSGPLVTLSDAPTPVLVNVKHNLVANGVDNPSLATVVHLDWAELGDSSKLKKYKTIVASDVIYDLETGIYFVIAAFFSLG